MLAAGLKNHVEKDCSDGTPRHDDPTPARLFQIRCIFVMPIFHDVPVPNHLNLRVDFVPTGDSFGQSTELIAIETSLSLGICCSCPGPQPRKKEKSRVTRAKDMRRFLAWLHCLGMRMVLVPGT